MKRQKILITATILLAVFAIVYWVWSGWGLITVEVTGKPLAEVIRSIEKQGGIVLATNMDTTRPVTMHVHKVPLTEALETLANRMDARWRLSYLFGPDAGTLKSGTAAFTGGKRPEGWKNFEVPLFVRPGSLADEVVPMDPRRDRWNVQEPAEKTLQAFMQAAATGVSASFACPETFNPAVAKVPSSGEIRKSAPQLAKAAGAKMEEVFLLLGRPAGVVEADTDRDRDEDGRPPRGRGGPPGGGNFTLMRERQLAEIAKLPASEQPAARAEFDEREKLFASIRELPEAERRAKMEEYMSKPENQDKMADRAAKRDERKTPEQRIAKYQKYVATKQQILNSGKK